MISNIAQLLRLFDIDHLEIANCSNLSIVFYLVGSFGQALFIRSCHEDAILTRKSHNHAGTAFVQGDSAGGSKLIEQTLTVDWVSRGCTTESFHSISALLRFYKFIWLHTPDLIFIQLIIPLLTFQPTDKWYLSHSQLCCKSAAILLYKPRFQTKFEGGPL